MNNHKNVATIYSEISPFLREVLLRLNRYEIENLTEEECKKISKEDVLKVLGTLDYSKHIIHNFHVVVADPPWPYHNIKTGGSMRSGAHQQYNTMKIEKMKKIGILLKDLTCGHGSLLFMWVTTNFQEEAMELVKSWGYKYKTKLYWIKPRLGMGWWFRNKVEELWICTSTKYRDTRAFHFQIPNVITAEPKKHSQKPDIRELVNTAIEKSFDTNMNIPKNKLEIFASRVQLDELVMNGNIKDNMEWKLHGHTIDNNRDIMEVLIDHYYAVPLRNFARMKIYDGFDATVDDLEFLKDIIEDRVNVSRRLTMVRADTREKNRNKKRLARKRKQQQKQVKQMILASTQTV